MIKTNQPSSEDTSVIYPWSPLIPLINQLINHTYFRTGREPSDFVTFSKHDFFALRVRKLSPVATRDSSYMQKHVWKPVNWANGIWVISMEWGQRIQTKTRSIVGYGLLLQALSFDTCRCVLCQRVKSAWPFSYRLTMLIIQVTNDEKTKAKRLIAWEIQIITPGFYVLPIRKTTSKPNVKHKKGSQ